MTIMLGVALLAMFGVVSSSVAGTATLTWNGVEGASGYRVFYGTSSRSYQEVRDVGVQTNATVTNLSPGTRYFFALQAYAGSLNSGFSEEVNGVVPGAGGDPVIDPPKALFQTSVNEGEAPLRVIFSDRSEGDIDSWFWRFGDGATSDQPSPQHTYQQPGQYTAVLEVRGPGGSDSQTTQIRVLEPVPPPVAGFSVDVSSGTAPLRVRFTDGSSGAISTRQWSFGDGGSSGAVNPEHTYQAPGTYSVQLTVTGPGGQ
ncbi:PKD domain-containing protein, partial [Thiocapsa imhoffii]